MPESSYLKYLPPVLWQDTPADAGFSLGSALCVFEKVLTGIDDGVPILHEKHTRAGDDSHTHRPIAERIAHLNRLLDPWATPEEFLPWLASWVSLRFPELQGRQLWDEYQRRKATAGISRTHRRRGLHSGLNALLELYSVGRVRPRVALDDGSCLFSARFDTGVPARVVTLPTFRPLLDATPAVVREGLMRPWCVAQGPDGAVFVGERGLPEDAALPHRRRVWRLDAAGRPDLAGSPPVPRPLMPQQNLGQVVAVTVAPAGPGRSETLYVLEGSGRILSLPAPYTADSATVVTDLSSTDSVFPLAMSVDGGGDLLVLDRKLDPGEEATPRVFVVRPAPVGVTVKNLDPAVVREPLSLFVDRDGSLVIGDGGDQRAPLPRGSGGGNLVRVVRGDPHWTHTPLLPPGNALVAPTAVTRVDADGLYVLDAGLRPFWPSATEDPFILLTALPACVHRVETADRGPAATTLQVTEPGRFVNPTGMTAAGPHVIICDPGQIESPGIGLDGYRSRIQAFDINVVIHFCAGDLAGDPAHPADPAEQRLELSRAVGTIKVLVEQHKPAHCRFCEVTMTVT
ncbi:phage tail protein [Streptomyces sp. NPDC014864]|uniref:phage tail protein n=1 Tax=Streptomyces sp. NPDC014864 TaxID=3364924 RepID=UPI0037034270